MSPPTKTEIFLDDLEVVVMHYRRQALLCAAAGALVALFLVWIF